MNVSQLAVVLQLVKEEQRELIKTWLELGHPFTDALHHTSSLVAQHHWKNTFGVGATQGVGVGVADPGRHDLKSKERHANQRTLRSYTRDYIGRAEGVKCNIVLTCMRTHIE